MGCVDKDTVERAELIMNEINAKPEDRSVVIPARETAEQASAKGRGADSIFCGAALKLHNGKIITGKNSTLMHAASSVILNAVKELGAIPDKIHLLSPNIIESIGNLKRNTLKSKTVNLDLEEALIALSISAATNPTSQHAMEQLVCLKGCEMHITHMPSPGDEAGLRKLGINLTCDPNYSTNYLFTG